MLAPGTHDSDPGVGSLHLADLGGRTKAAVSFMEENFNIYLMTDSPEVNFQDPPSTGRP